MTTQIYVSELGVDTYSGYIKVNANDIGNDYVYKINAVNKLDETDVVASNTAVTAAISDIKGYAYRIDTNSQSEPDIISDEDCFVSSDGELTISVDNYKPGVVYYLHIYALDNAGNISEETIYEFAISSYPFNTPTNIETDIATDKTEYSFGDIALIDVAVKTDFYKLSATGVVEIYDSNDTLVDTIETGYIVEITSYEKLYRQFVWDVKNISAGNYKASIKWYDEETLLASDSANFKIVPNGTITDTVTTDKAEYITNENIKVSDSIYNNTTNTSESSLILDIDIYSTDNKEMSLKTFTAEVSSIAGNISTYSDYVDASTLGIGDYVAVSQVKNSQSEVISSSFAYFSVLDYTQISEEYSGIIKVNPVSNKEKEFTYSITNTSNKDGKDLLIKANVYNSDGEFISAIEKTSDIKIGETVDFKELFNTEALRIDNYPVTLTVTEDGNEAVLASSGFVIDTISRYTVTFVDDDGTVLDTQSIEYGKSATPPESPEKTATQKYYYIFSGWDSDYTNITKDVTIKAVYKVVEIPTDDTTQPDTTTPDTSDNVYVEMFVLALIMIVSLFALVFIAKAIKRNNF